MTNQDEQDGAQREKSEMRIMWIGTAVMVGLILALMGYNMWAHPNAGNEPTELSSQSRSAPAQ